MNKNVYRNVALVTTVFALAMIVMMGTSWLQMRKATPLQSDVMETLKQLNENNDENEKLAEEIRQLDLLSRKAYFTQKSHLKIGAWILFAMGLVIGASLRMYFKDTKDLPEKDLNPIDEWMSKSKSRKYIRWGVGGLVAASLLVALLNSEGLRSKVKDVVESADEQLAQAGDTDAAPTDSPEQDGAEGVQANDSTAAGDSTMTAEAVRDSFPTPRLTSNSFRGNSSLGHSSARGIPTSWDLKSGKNILWQKQIPKHGYNSPVINGRNIFLTGADNQARELYCFDLWTGELRWTVKADGIAGSPSSMPKVNADTGLAASTVATNGSQVCAIFATGDVICSDMEGKRLWAKNIGVPNNHYGFASSLLMVGNELIIQYDNRDTMMGRL